VRREHGGQAFADDEELAVLRLRPEAARRADRVHSLVEELEAVGLDLLQPDQAPRAGVRRVLLLLLGDVVAHHRHEQRAVGVHAQPVLPLQALSREIRHRLAVADPRAAAVPLLARAVAGEVRALRTLLTLAVLVAGLRALQRLELVRLDAGEVGLDEDLAVVGARPATERAGDVALAVARRVIEQDVPALLLATAEAADLAVDDRMAWRQRREVRREHLVDDLVERRHQCAVRAFCSATYTTALRISASTAS
jgi:hypothetical protein